MLVSQLKRLEGCELAGEAGCRSLLHDKLGAAYRFRALCPAQGSLDITFSDDVTYLPRDYIDLVVDRVRMQNTLRFGIQVRAGCGGLMGGGGGGWVVGWMDG